MKYDKKLCTQTLTLHEIHELIAKLGNKLPLALNEGEDAIDQRLPNYKELTNVDEIEAICKRLDDLAKTINDIDCDFHDTFDCQ